MTRRDLAKPRRHASKPAAAVVLLMAMGLAGCSTPSWLCFAPPGPSSITLIALPDANGDSAIPVDLVFVSDRTAAQQISSLSAEQYFTRRTQLLRDFPTGIQVRSWELAPGQIARKAATNPTCNRVTTLLFVRLNSPGDHRQVLSGSSSPVVSLDAKDFVVSP